MQREQCSLQSWASREVFPTVPWEATPGVVSSPSPGGSEQTWLIDLQSEAWSSGRGWPRPGPHEASLMRNVCSGTWKALGLPAKVASGSGMGMEDPLPLQLLRGLRAPGLGPCSMQAGLWEGRGLCLCPGSCTPPLGRDGIQLVSDSRAQVNRAPQSL